MNELQNETNTDGSEVTLGEHDYIEMTPETL